MKQASPSPTKRTITAAPKPDRATLCARFWALPDEALVDRPTAAAAGNLSSKYLELLACKGGGPDYSVIGRCAMYRKADVLAWLSKARKVASTADRASRAAEHV
jgi:hypothetical protein